MSEKECPECGFRTDEEICLSCGALLKKTQTVMKVNILPPVIPPANICPGCNNTITSGKNFCAFCGYKVNPEITKGTDSYHLQSFTTPGLHEGPSPPYREPGKTGNNTHIILSIIIVTVIMMCLIVFAVTRNKSSFNSSNTSEKTPTQSYPSPQPTIFPSTVQPTPYIKPSQDYSGNVETSVINFIKNSYYASLMRHDLNSFINCFGGNVESFFGSQNYSKEEIEGIYSRYMQTYDRIDIKTSNYKVRSIGNNKYVAEYDFYINSVSSSTGETKCDRKPKRLVLLKQNDSYKIISLGDQ